MDRSAPDVAETRDEQADLTQPVVVDANTLPWVSVSKYNQSRRMLARRFIAPKWSTELVLVHGGGGVPSHLHPHGAEIYVLAGELNDEHGEYRWGTYIRNPHGFRHASFSYEGCCFLILDGQVTHAREKRVVVDSEELPWRLTDQPGVEYKLLYAQPAGPEWVELQRWAAGTRVVPDEHGEGMEVYVLAGELNAGPAALRDGVWLRCPAAHLPEFHSVRGCTLFIKRGHLPWQGQAG